MEREEKFANTSFILSLFSIFMLWFNYVGRENYDLSNLLINILLYYIVASPIIPITFGIFGRKYKLGKIGIVIGILLICWNILFGPLTMH